jgi:NAD+ synthase (glutamine-hydrolysing)
MTEVENSARFEKPTTDYLRVATVSPEVAPADVATNTAALASAYEAAKAEQAELLVTPELSLTGYTAADLFHNQHVLDNAEYGLEELADLTKDGPAMLVGVPLRRDGVLYNCAVMLAGGRMAGAVPKTYLPNAKEFYERRWFTSGKDIAGETIRIGGRTVPFGTDLLWNVNGTKVAAEICEDMFAPINPGTHAALAGAEVVANLSASNELIGKAEYRKLLISSFTGKAACAYVYASAGRGESVADVIYGGHQIIAENGRIVAERAPLSDEDRPLVQDIDRTYLEHDRLVEKTWADQADSRSYRAIDVVAPLPRDQRLLRFVDAAPFVPGNPETLDQRCEELFSYTSHALARRIREKNTRGLVLGLSGGLDSTLALLTALETAKQLGEPADFIHTTTMPARASSERTQDNASRLAEALGTTHKVIPVQELTDSLLADIGHDKTTQDLTYENTQARTRTNILMNYANMIKGMVQGTGDMSEAANGFCTYNGDHMSMFNPNGGIPKTLVKHLVRWYADNRADEAVSSILHDILETPISPELTGSGDLSQTTEDIVGPYELADFFLFELNRHGSEPAKIGYLATKAFAETYDEPTIGKWLDTFLRRYTDAQWKRDVMPNTTKVGTIALSPRGDLRLAPNTGHGWYK